MSSRFAYVIEVTFDKKVEHVFDFVVLIRFIVHVTLSFNYYYYYLIIILLLLFIKLAQNSFSNELATNCYLLMNCDR